MKKRLNATGLIQTPVNPDHLVVQGRKLVINPDAEKQIGGIRNNTHDDAMEIVEQVEGVE